ncbi:hypothetical protein LF1_52180 [Rubripirellula obstinata]|uniref:Uncharacterized protein n=1 Tax=Rubripirellula obstinata TaxID=406547 RepID=A0A5B1CCF8_9BACT|nr:hypothetical protein LF1_52180 [Rubripirellula obstinata]
MVGLNVCLHDFTRRPQNADVIRLSRGHSLPSSRPAGHNPCSTKTGLPPTLDETEVPTALRGTNQRLNSNAQLMPVCRMHCVAQPTPTFLHLIYCCPTKLARTTTLCYDLNTVMVTHGNEARAVGPYLDGAFRITIACTGVAAARFPLCLHVKSRHLGDAYRYPTEPRTFAARLAPCGAYPMLDQNRFAPNPQSILEPRLPCGAPTDA